MDRYVLLGSRTTGLDMLFEFHEATKLSVHRKELIAESSSKVSLINSGVNPIPAVVGPYKVTGLLHSLSTD